MFGSEALDVGIGIVLLFLFMSLTATAAQEGLEGLLKLRGADLERGIRELLDDPGRRTGFWQRIAGIGSLIARPLVRNPESAEPAVSLTRTFYQHPFIYALYSGQFESSGRNLPSYIPSSSFAGALLDILARGAVTALPSVTPAGAVPTIETLRAKIISLPSERLQRAVLAALDQAGGDLGSVKAELERYFDATMDRVAGWYKRRTQAVLFVLGFAVAASLNVDPLTIAGRLATDKALRAAAVAQAERLTAPTNEAAALPDELKTRTLSALRDDIATLGFPIGWQSGAEKGALFGFVPKPQACPVLAGGLQADAQRQAREGCEMGVRRWAATLLGWFVTALATMLGAPFWFDLLNKVMVIRATVKPHEKSQDEASEDRQIAPPAAQPLARAVKPAPPNPPGGAPALPASPALAGLAFAKNTWSNEPNPDEGLA